MKQSRLGLPTLVGLVIANMIGAGVFTTSGFALGDLGSPVFVLLAWVAGSVIALAGAASYGMLARLMPASGGEYLFLSRTVHPAAGFVAGWISLLAGFTGAIAFAAITFEAYLAPVPGLAFLPDRSIATAAILVAALVHGIHIRYGTGIQNTTVLVKLILITLFILYAVTGTSAGDWQGLAGLSSGQQAEFSLTAFAMTLMWVSFSFCGFNAAVYVAGEAKDARRLVPKAMLLATLITSCIYLLLNGIFVLAPAYEDVAFQEDVAAIAAIVLGGERAAAVVRGIIALALFTSISSMVMIGPRVYAKMADDGLFPGALKFNRETPDIAIVLQAVLAIVVVWVSGLRELLSYLGFTLGLSAAATICSLFVISRRDPSSLADVRGYPLVPLVFVVFTLLFAGLAATRNPAEMLAALVTIASGLIMYRVFRRNAG